MTSVTFTVEGEPAPKGSHTAGRRNNGSAFVRDASKRTKPWENAVTAAAEDAATGTGQIAPPYAVSIDVFRARPKRPSWQWPTKDDLDKVVRCTIDGLVKSGLLLDDRHVLRLTASEKYVRDAPSGCKVTITTVDPNW